MPTALRHRTISASISLTSGPVELNCFGDLAADRIDGIERSGRFLKNVGDTSAADAAEMFYVHLENMFTAKNDIPVENFRRRLREASG